MSANLVAIMRGLLVFDEPIGSGPLAIGARFLAFCLVIVGAALIGPSLTVRRNPPANDEKAR